MRASLFWYGAAEFETARKSHWKACAWRLCADGGKSICDELVAESACPFDPLALLCAASLDVAAGAAHHRDRSMSGASERTSSQRPTRRDRASIKAAAGCASSDPISRDTAASSSSTLVSGRASLLTSFIILVETDPSALPRTTSAPGWPRRRSGTVRRTWGHLMVTPSNWHSQSQQYFGLHRTVDRYPATAHSN
jgi:hypothetical protein